jgi:hypothetical protein
LNEALGRRIGSVSLDMRHNHWQCYNHGLYDHVPVHKTGVTNNGGLEMPELFIIGGWIFLVLLLVLCVSIIVAIFTAFHNHK